MDDRFAASSNSRRRALRAAPAAFLILAACSRASLLGGPGPEVEHHAAPAEIERLALAEPVKSFDSKEACKARLEALAHEHGAEVIKISEKEYRTYASTPWGEGETHHEYSCAGKDLTERSWGAKADGADAHHAEEAH
jgi:hypothetical protein